jgi:hypothetical protein
LTACDVCTFVVGLICMVSPPVTGWWFAIPWGQQTIIFDLAQFHSTLASIRNVGVTHEGVWP